VSASTTILHAVHLFDVNVDNYNLCVQTWPERWDTSGKDLSKMHGCYNGIGLWFIEGLAGIRVHASEEPPLTIRAGVDAGDIGWARGHRAALHGQAESSWALVQSGFTHNMTIPVSAVAKVLLPSANGLSGVTERGKPLSSVVGVTTAGEEMVNGISYVVLMVLSGKYEFKTPWTRTMRAL
jgi:hypothetical protein